MDEAGRGSWAGPVVAAAVILPPKTRLPGLTDSKLLTEKKREQLYERIITKCEHGIGMASQQEVDEYGLLHATFLAYERALSQLSTQPDHLWIDGRDKFKFAIPHTSIIKGDLKKRCISAASVLAKVYRDRLMVQQATSFPEYGFDLHKGYGTKRHQQSLKEHGPCELHRQSYQPIQQLFVEQTDLGI